MEGTDWTRLRSPSFARSWPSGMRTSSTGRQSWNTPHAHLCSLMPLNFFRYYKELWKVLADAVKPSATVMIVVPLALQRVTMDA